MSKRILMVCTSHSTINNQQKTGLWLEEFATPYMLFKQHGFEVEVTSVQGGPVPLDPNSIPEENNQNWREAEQALKETKKLKVEYANGIDAIFLPGGHGTMFDFPNNEVLQSVIQSAAEREKIIGAVCHGPSAFVNVTYKDGTPIVKGHQMNSFTDAEEKEMGLDSDMPFLLETTLRERGADFASGEAWKDYSVKDGHFVTGQNPMSSESTAKKVIEALEG
ncbi:type 1 glutamine amidotransferase domain-containing protein [Bacillus shivajii]|uniref:type 1 glutamine amidotransferase domain-containing protein n=1 Tax=Bacillus shivajii TaxID=1983719 RepID=UPI001CFAE13D|nr:type 1 glutamine amidotransferase domain-containing protein [Bacillus shivajii]UCZ53123.1 type 1 glutamine amidotransferase domain-containing protein [Bacillus shivajii]